MTGESARRDRYDVSGNTEAEYVDAERSVLVNKLGINVLETLQIAEEKALARAYAALLSEVREDARLTEALICYVHKRIFGDVYSWAGTYRTVWIHKPGITWPPPDFLPQNMSAFEQQVLSRHSPGTLTEDNDFVAAAAEIQGEFLTIHPFREGNARTIKLVTDLMAAQTGRGLLRYDETENGQQQYIAAAAAAFKRNYAPLEAIIAAAIQNHG